MSQDTGIDRGLSIDSGGLTITFKGVQVDSQADLQNLIIATAPMAAQAAFDARAKRARDWSVSGTVTTTSGGTTTSATGTYSGKDYTVSASGSTTVGGATVTGTVSTGTQGTSGTITVGGTF